MKFRRKMPSIPCTELSGYSYRYNSEALAEVQAAYTNGGFCGQILHYSVGMVVVKPTLHMHPRTSDGDWLCGIGFLVNRITAELLFPWQSIIDNPNGPCAQVRMYCTEVLQDRSTDMLIRRIARQLQADKR